MLVCPQCQYENPNTHKFCQKCGVSLTEVVCPGCDATVPSNVECCPHCGTVTGTIWWALLFTSVPPQQAKTDTSVAPTINQAAIEFESSTIAQYLDSQQRYQILDALPSPASSSAELEVRVLDCQPYQPTLLAALYQQQNYYTESSPPTSSPLEASTDLLETTRARLIPAMAHPYLSMQPQLHSALPQLHDAWATEEKTVLLLEDRSTLPLLSEMWKSPDLLPLQLLHWLYEMTELWGILEPQQCCQSLLELTNLRVDEDQLLCLQRLYADSEPGLSLKDLGKLWQFLFQMSQREAISSLTQLCCALENEEITDLDELRSHFEVIANELQPTSINAAAMAPPSLSPYLEEERHPSLIESPYPTSSSSFQQDQSTIYTHSSAAARGDTGNLDSNDSTNDSDDIPTVVLPMKLIGFEDAGRSDVGQQREHNEDCFSIQTDVQKAETLSGRTLQAKGLYILCDGMGGHAGGEVASALAVDTLKNYFAANWGEQLPSEAHIQEAIYQANKAIYDLNQQNDRSGSGRMGTTLILVLVQDTSVAVAHVGDSRLYRFSRRRGLEQITVDHEVGQREIQRGVEPAIAYARPDAYQLTQALGPRDEAFVSPDIQFIEFNEDLLLLLCSDGLTDNDLLEAHWQSHIEPLLSSQTNLEQGVNQLIDLANTHNGHDNITAFVIRAKVRPNLEQLRR